MSGVDTERLRELLKERGITPRALSRMVGDNAYLVRDILSGRSRNARSDTIAKLAEKLEVAPSTLLRGSAGRPSYDPRLVPTFLPVRYRVQAGHWVEIDTDEPPSQVSHAVAPDPRYANWPQWLELVQGDSANLKIQDGQLAHVVDACEMGYAPRDGDWVVVERPRAGTRERTIKQVALNGKNVELWPRSTNPRWSEPISLRNGVGDGEEIEVEIVGLVIGAYHPF